MLPTSRSRAGKAGCPWYPASFRTLAVVTGLGIAFAGNGHAFGLDVVSQSWLRQPLCVQWDLQAGDAIARRVATSRDEIDLSKLGDHIFRMRRARRSCDLGLIQKACQDYAAIVWNAYGVTSVWPGFASVCLPSVSGEPMIETQQSKADDE